MCNPHSPGPSPTNAVTGRATSRRTLLKAGAAAGAATACLHLNGLTAAERALAAPGGAVKLNLLFIGAHPDDEASTLATLGQWNEFHGMRAGVITITRGEGGGNAVGLEEGPPLGMLREAEERTAVGYAGIRNIFNLDAVDFYYTASAPLSREVWGGDEVLNRIVRVVRATRPDVIVTMNPSAVEGNHGNHQQAAMYAVEAYLAAGDRTRFPEHLAEGFDAWQPRRILRAGANGKGATGPNGVETGYQPTVASEVVFGTWNGTMCARHGKRWSEVLDQAKWAYVTQGWANQPAAPKDPALIPSAWYTVIHSRTPIVSPTSGDDAALRGAALPIAGGLPFGTLIDVRPARYEVVGGEHTEVIVKITAPAGGLAASTLTLTPPDGWKLPTTVNIPALRKGSSHVASFKIEAPRDAAVGTPFRVQATLLAGGASGSTFAQMRVAGAVEATIEPLEEIRDFRAWTRKVGMKHLDALVPELMAIGQGRSREVTVLVENYSTVDQGGSVSVTVPSGFTTAPTARAFSRLAAGSSGRLTFTMTNTDPTLPTANRGPNAGAWPVDITATTEGLTATRRVTLNLVPSHAVSRTAITPAVDGVWSASKYPDNSLPVDTVWDGKPMGGTNPSISGQAWISHDDANLYVFVSVKDDVRGTILPTSDNKRQRRTDSVEIYVDPRGSAPNTAHTFIAGIMPSMDSMTGAPGVGRDRDNWQGEAVRTAPGMEVKVLMASTEATYTGYDLEAKIPFSVLPDNLDPSLVGFNVVINDSDTQNKAAQTRVGWSTFPGMRADPWRWGQLTFEGLKDLASQRKDPILPDSAARSVESPQSILQSASDGVPLGGFAPTKHDLKLQSAKLSGGVITASIQTADSGVVRAYAWDGTKVVGQVRLTVRRGVTKVRFGVEDHGSGSLVLAVSLEGAHGVRAASREVQ